VVDLAVANIGYVVAGYAVAVAGLGAYAGYLMMRARRARLRAAAIAAKRAR
jgi:hypothetical protein